MKYIESECHLNNKNTPQANDSETLLPDTLNYLHARFEALNETLVFKTPPPHPPPLEEQVCLDSTDVRRTLSRVNPRKAAGPDNIPGLRDCANQLADVSRASPPQASNRPPSNQYQRSGL